MAGSSVAWPGTVAAYWWSRAVVRGGILRELGSRELDWSNVFVRSQTNARGSGTIPQ